MRRARLTLRGRLLRRGLLRRRLLGGGLLGRRLRGRRRAAVAVARLDGVEAGLQRGHEVGHRRLVLVGGRLDGDLLALRLALDEREDLLAVGVLVLLELERARQRVDELLGDVELARVDLDVLGGGELVDRRRVDDLVGIDHRRHRRARTRPSGAPRRAAASGG